MMQKATSKQDFTIDSRIIILHKSKPSCSAEVRSCYTDTHTTWSFSVSLILSLPSLFYVHPFTSTGIHAH